MKRWITAGLVCGCLGWGWRAGGADPVSPNAATPEAVVIPFTSDTLGPSSSAALPPWIKGCGQEGGAVDAGASGWRAAAELPEGIGKVWIELDRMVLNEDIALTVSLESDSSTDMAIQLWDDEGRVVALDLFGSVPAVSAAAGTGTFIVPLRAHPTATRIVLRRIAGMVTLHGVVVMPVLTPRDGELDVLLELSKLLRDPLSPDSDLARRVQAILDGARATRPETRPAAAGGGEVQSVRPIVLAPAGAVDGPGPAPVLRFAGYEWQALRTDFEMRDDAVFPLPRARRGFDYGHCGHGRGPTLVTHVGDRAWRDVRIEMDVCSTGVNPALDPHRLNPAYSGFAVMFRVVDYAESWNDKAWSTAAFYVMNEGDATHWEVGTERNYYCAVPRGHFNEQAGGRFRLASGTGLNLDRERGNHVAIEVRGARVRVWFDGQAVCDVADPRLLEEYQGVRLDHGGVGVSWGFDTMGWVRNVRVDPLQDQE